MGEIEVGASRTKRIFDTMEDVVFGERKTSLRGVEYSFS